MTFEELKQTLKVLADDTRLRAINVLKDREMTVKEICSTLGVSQPSISKHLVKLRLLGVVVDRRVGNRVYYSLNKHQNSEQMKIVYFLISEIECAKAFKEDTEELDKKVGV